MLTVCCAQNRKGWHMQIKTVSSELSNNFSIINARCYFEGHWCNCRLEVRHGIITEISKIDEQQELTIADNNASRDEMVNANEMADEEFNLSIDTLDLEGAHLFPGFTDVHVHFREPGRPDKETILSGSKAAAHGGFTCVCTMPNLNPVPDCLENLELQLAKIEEAQLIHVLPYGAITKQQKGRELADMEALAPYVCAFTDDGFGVQNPEMMRQAMYIAKSLNKCIVAHAEDESLVRGGVIHDGEYARKHNHRGNPSASEWKQVERDVELAGETGAGYHVCHVSTKESASLVAIGAAKGYDVSFETAPHYLLLNDLLLQEDGRFRMNPPIRSSEDQAALIQALKNGDILCIATDHAPHTAAEKSRGLDDSLNGIVGIETSFPVLYTGLVRKGIISLEKLIELMSFRAVERFRLYEVKELWPSAGIARAFAIGQPADLTVFDLNASYIIDPQDFLSKGKASPFSGEEVYGKCLLTLVGGKIAYQA